MRICAPRKVFVTSAHEPGNSIAMPAVAFSSSDAELLSRYLREGCEASFAALVQAHQRMVLGTALRRTGDAEMARDVAQQVFALLAQKRYGWPARESRGWCIGRRLSRGAGCARRSAGASAARSAGAESAGMVSDAREWSVLDDELSALGGRNARHWCCTI